MLVLNSGTGMTDVFFDTDQKAQNGECLIYEYDVHNNDLIFNESRILKVYYSFEEFLYYLVNRWFDDTDSTKVS